MRGAGFPDTLDENIVRTEAEHRKAPPPLLPEKLARHFSDTRMAAPVVALFEGLPATQTGKWADMICGWFDGLGFNGRPPTPADVATGAAEFLAAGVERKPVAFRRFVERARDERVRFAANGNGPPAEDAATLHALLSPILHLHGEQFTQAVDGLVEQGRIPDKQAFLEQAGRLDFLALRNARDQRQALDHIRQRLSA